MPQNANPPPTMRQRRERDAATRYEPAVRTRDDGSHYGVVYETEGRSDGEVWYDTTSHADRATAFAAACAKADDLTALLLEAWDLADQDEHGDGSCGSCGGSGHGCPRCGNTGRERPDASPLFNYAVSLARAHAKLVGGALS